MGEENPGRRVSPRRASAPMCRRNPSGPSQAICARVGDAVQRQRARRPTGRAGASNSRGGANGDSNQPKRRLSRVHRRCRRRPNLANPASNESIGRTFARCAGDRDEVQRSLWQARGAARALARRLAPCRRPIRCGGTLGDGRAATSGAVAVRRGRSPRVVAWRAPRDAVVACSRRRGRGVAHPQRVQRAVTTRWREGDGGPNTLVLKNTRRHQRLEHRLRSGSRGGGPATTRRSRGGRIDVEDGCGRTLRGR